MYRPCRKLLRPWVLAHLLAPLWLAPEAFGQFDPEAPVATDIRPSDVIHWRANTALRDSKGVIEISLQLSTEQDFSIYVDKLKVNPIGELEDLSQVSPAPTVQIDPISGKEVEVYRGGDFRFYFKSTGKSPLEQISVELTYLGCTARICLFPFTETLQFTVYESPNLLQWDNKDKTPPSNASANEEGFESQFAEQIKGGKFSVLMLFLVVFIGGLATNLTPCVAPMIPITIRLLARQKFSPTLNASLYALGIMITYTMLGSIATFSGSAFGTFMALPSVNLVFAGVMALLGLSMLGFGDLSALQNIGARIGSGAPSAHNTFLMGAGAGLVAAPCTGPVLGALMAYSAGQASALYGIALMATYSFGFALPYIFLGRAAVSMTKIRVSPYTQIATKLIFASVMFGLAFYYLRIPAYDLIKLLRPHWQVLALSFSVVGIGGIAICTLVQRLQNSKISFVLPCIICGFGVFSSWQSWTTGNDVTAASHSSTWHRSLDEAIAAAKLSGKPILMDNWAEWCEACKKMDITTFADNAVVQELAEHWEVVKLDLTQGSAEDDAHLARFSITGLPTLVLLPSDGDVDKHVNIVGYVNAAGLLRRLQEFKGQ